MGVLEYETPPPKRHPGRAVAALICCCILWGFSFPVMQIATHAFDHAAHQAGNNAVGLVGASATFNAWRFGLAALVYCLLVRPSTRSFRREDLLAGLMIGLFFSVGMLLQVAGLRYTLPSVSSFLTSLVVVLAPVGQLVLFRKPVRGLTWLAVVLAVAGIFILSQPNAAAAVNTLTRTPPVRNLGEILTVLGCVLFTAQILVLSSPLGAAAHPVRVTVLMLVVTGLVNVVTGLIMSGTTYYSIEMLSRAFRDPQFLWSTGGLIFLSTLLALHLMNRFQPEVSAAAASVIYCLEPVFGTLWSVGFRTEQLTVVTAVGGMVILLAVLTVAASPGPAAPEKS